LLSAIKAHDRVLFLSLEQCFAFVGELASARLYVTNTGRMRVAGMPWTEFGLQYRLEEKGATGSS
jgi:hypothetical protein